MPVSVANFAKGTNWDVCTRAKQPLAIRRRKSPGLQYALGYKIKSFQVDIRVPVFVGRKT
jgi:hypothetical protein